MQMHIITSSHDTSVKIISSHGEPEDVFQVISRVMHQISGTKMVSQLSKHGGHHKLKRNQKRQSKNEENIKYLRNHVIRRAFVVHYDEVQDL